MREKNIYTVVYKILISHVRLSSLHDGGPGQTVHPSSPGPLIWKGAMLNGSLFFGLQTFTIRMLKLEI